VGVREVVALKGSWNAKQLKARDELTSILRGSEFTDILEKHVLSRPEGFVPNKAD